MREKIRMIIFVLTLGSALTVGLIAVNSATTPIIAAHQERALRLSILRSLGYNHDGTNVEQLFEEKIRVEESGAKQVYRTSDGRIAFEYAGSGLWGPITGVLALSDDLQTIDGITITHQEETPGLGGRIAEIPFLDGFKGKSVFPSIIVTGENKAEKDNEINGISGATLSCKAFEKILNSETSARLASIKRSKH